MRWTVPLIIAAAFLAAILAAYILFREVYLPQKAAALIDARLAQLPVKVLYEIDAVRLFPPTITFSFLSAAPPERGPAASLNG